MPPTNQDIIEAARKGLDGRGYYQTAFHPHELVGNIEPSSNPPGTPPSQWFVQFKTQETEGQTIYGRRISGPPVYVRMMVQATSDVLEAIDFSQPAPHPYPTPIW